MSVTIISKDVGDVKDKFISMNYKWMVEDRCEDYIKKEMRI